MRCPSPTYGPSFIGSHSSDSSLETTPTTVYPATLYGPSFIGSYSSDLSLFSQLSTHTEQRRDPIYRVRDLSKKYSGNSNPSSARTDNALALNHLDTLPPIVGPDLSWPHPIYREGAHPIQFPNDFVDPHNQVPTPIDDICSRNCPKHPISSARQQERPVYGTGNSCGCPARAHSRSDNPKYFQQTILAINGIHLGVDVYGTGNPCGCPDWQHCGCPDWQQSPISGTLVLLHGFTGSTANWQNLLSHLDLPGWRIIALDMLGHGRSDAPADPQRYSIEHCQQDIIAALRELGIKPGEAILLGYSMGGRIALYSAFSGFFRAIILESASPGLANSAERAKRRDSDNDLAHRIERDGLPAFVAYWEQLPLFASQSALPRETRANLREQRLRNRPAGLANSLRGLGTGMQPSLHDRLQELHIPVLLIAGALDTKYCAIAHHMAAALPNSTLHIVNNAGHTVHLEQPTIFAAQVHQFCLAML